MLAQENSCPSEGFPNHAVLSATLSPLIHGIHPEDKAERISISPYAKKCFCVYFKLCSNGAYVKLFNALVVIKVNDHDSPGKIIPNSVLPSNIGDSLFFRCNYDINYVKVNDDLPKFYKNLISHWQNLNITVRSKKWILRAKSSRITGL